MLTNKTLKIERQCIFPEGNTNPILADLKTTSSKREIELTNDDVKEIKEGMECGIGIDGAGKFKEDDVIVAYEIQSIKRTLEV